MVVDYVWGEPAARAMVDLLSVRKDRGAPLTWIQIGSVAGPTAPIASAALRSARLRARAVALADVEPAWAEAATTRDRLVIVPQATPSRRP
ncbi:MAG TPA: hypothetical protein VGP16_00680 [Asanoa sp.]|nr:hypothetical protein [Asanoa sp.]